MNILIAEDEPVSRKVLAHHLAKWGHRVAEAKDGLEALVLYERGAFDIVITDYMMPNLDGNGLARRIRELDKDRSYTYIIMLSALTSKENVLNSLNMGKVDDYISKPCEPEMLRARLQVGERTVNLERSVKDHCRGLEVKLREQTLEIKKSQEDTIIRLLAALEYRDVETGSHVRRLGLTSALLAEHIGWSDEMVDDIRMAAPMHDIGKIGVPDSILCKPAKLTDEEFDTIKTHTTIGGVILEGGNGSMLRMAHDIALYHHERWDGRGYPTGSQGAQIPQAARIVSVADSFDAMSYNRVYRSALDEEKVLSILREERGAQFDSELVDAFLEIMPAVRMVQMENPHVPHQESES